MKPIVVKNIDELDSVALTLLDGFGKNRIVCLYGGMGAGKTTLIKSFCKALGVVDNVVSPTFALINEYTTPKGLTIFHFDFYRIEKIEEVFDFGYEEYFYSTEGLCFIEWPELVEDILPKEGVSKIKIDVEEDLSRIITHLE